MDKLFKLHLKKVVLKNGKAGLITAVTQDALNKPIMYLVEVWTDNGKIQTWYDVEDFTVKEVPVEELIPTEIIKKECNSECGKRMRFPTSCYNEKCKYLKLGV